MAKPEMNSRLDYFAQVAMSALMTSNVYEMGMIRTENETGINRYKTLAEKCYEIAQYMEAEALLQPEPDS